MKVLSLLQPWATLVVIGAKTLETRSWPCGPAPYKLAIHAGKSTKDLYQLFTAPPFFEVLWAAGFRHSDALPRAGVIGTVDVLSSKPTDQVLHELTAQERAFGDFGPDRFAWYLKNPAGFPSIPMRGNQGLRELPAEILAQIPEMAL